MNQRGTAAVPDLEDPSVEIDEGPTGAARLGRFLGPLLAGAAVAATHPAGLAWGGCTADQSWVLGLFVWMAVWWMTLAVDPAVTGLLPIVARALLGIGKPAEIVAPYADDVMFLFAGGALLGLALERTGVSQRFAAWVVSLAGTSPLANLAAIMGVTALLSAFVSNLATAATMLPLAIALGSRARASASTPDAAVAATRFSTSLLLGVAFASSIGGVLTPIGSPPNPIAVKWLNENGIAMDFARWLRVSVPLTAVFLPLSVVVLGMWLFPARGLRVPAFERASGPLGRDGWKVLAVFGLAVAAWVTMPLYGAHVPAVRDGTVAVFAALVLFLLPSSARQGQRLLVPTAFAAVPWRVLVLFGGGLCLANAMQATGLSGRIGDLIAAAGTLPAIAVTAVMVTALVFASEVASNTALAAMTVPIVGAIAPKLGIAPEALVIPAVFAASWAFAMPVGTPPNALVFASGRLRVQDMMRAGLVLDLLAIVVIVAMSQVVL